MKKTSTSKDTLAAKILELELQEKQQMNELKESFQGLAQSVNPVNLFKGAMKSVIETPGLRTTALDTAISVGSGILTRKLIVRKSGGFLRKLAGTALQFLVTNLVRNKIPEVKEKMIHPTNGVHKQ